MNYKNEIEEEDRVNHYAKYGVREIFFRGGNERQSFSWMYEQEGNIIVRQRTVFNWDNDEIDDLAVLLELDEFLASIGKARLGDQVQIKSIGMTLNGLTYLSLSNRGFSVNTQTIQNAITKLNFDRLFLDSFSVIENSEPRLRTARDIWIGPAEKSLMEIVSKNPDILRSFSPREFEVFVSTFLKNIGFSRVCLSRFVKDGGYDIYAVYFEDNSEHTALVEVKHYTSKKVGIEIVDRINGVRDREAADRAVIITTSSFSAEAVNRYNAASNRVTIIDYERLVDFLARDSSNWKRTPSELWTLPRFYPDKKLDLEKK